MFCGVVGYGVVFVCVRCVMPSFVGVGFLFIHWYMFVLEMFHEHYKLVCVDCFSLMTCACLCVDMFLCFS